jgi:hypothetical protein
VNRFRGDIKPESCAYGEQAAEAPPCLKKTCVEAPPR